jgi:hypothetical protein
MAINSTFKASSITWSGNTWSAQTQGGPIAVSFTHSGRVIEDRTGDNEYPVVIGVPDKSASVTVTLREVAQTLDIGGTAENLSFTIAGKASVTVTVTLASMVLVDVSGGQSRGEFGSTVLHFVHESSDGTTKPIS